MGAAVGVLSVTAVVVGCQVVGAACGLQEVVELVRWELVVGLGLVSGPGGSG